MKTTLFEMHFHVQTKGDKMSVEKIEHFFINNFPQC